MAFVQLFLPSIMTQNASNNDKTWTEKHLKFVLKYRLKGVCQTLWEWLIKLSRESKDIEFNLRDFQKYVKRLAGKANCLKWVRIVFKKLVFLRIVSIDKDFGHDSYRINLRHPDAVIPKIRKEINFHHVPHNSNLEASNDCNSETRSSSSSNTPIANDCTDSSDTVVGNKFNEPVKDEEIIDKKEWQRRLLIIKLCARYNVLFNPKKQTTKELYKYPIEDIGKSLELYKFRNKKGEIDNPPGWIVSCLRNRFFEDCYYCFDSFIADMNEVFFNIRQASG